jgi:O-antigen ligase
LTAGAFPSPLYWHARPDDADHRAESPVAEPDPPSNPLRGVRWPFIYAAFLLYIFVITTYQLGIATIAMSAGALGLLFQRDAFRLPSLLLWFGLYLVWCAIAYIKTPYPTLVWDFLFQYGKLWVIMLVTLNALRSRPQIRFFMVFFLACFALYPLRGAFINYYVFHETLFGRAYWNFIYSNPNDLAAIAVLQLSLVAGLLVTEPKGWVRSCALIGAGLLPLLILMTQSRAAFIALSVFVLFVLFGPRTHSPARARMRRKPRKKLIALAIVGAAVALAAPDGVWDRVRGMREMHDTENLGAIDDKGSARQRFEVWKVASRIISDNPVSGVGLGGYNLAHESYAARGAFDREVQGKKDAHSTYLHVAAESGIPGLFIFLVIVLSTALRAERIRRLCKRVLPRRSAQLLYLEAGLIAFLVAGIFGSFQHLSFLYIHLALLLVVAEACRRDVTQLYGTRRRSKHER